jgi:hypothetical protein
MCNKRVLILRACGSKDEDEECVNIASQCKLYGFEVDDYCPRNHKELKESLHSGKKYDYIYLSSHGNEKGFGNEDNTIDVPWCVFSYLRESQCMQDDCIIYLSCCRGGLHQVAYDLFLNCSSISYIVGPRQSLSSAEMLISFSILLFNLEYRNIDPIVASEKIKCSTDLRFICFDRLETLEEYGFLLFVQHYDNDEQARLTEEFEMTIL